MLQADMHVPYDKYLQLIEKAWTADFTPKSFTESMPYGYQRVTVC